MFVTWHIKGQDIYLCYANSPQVYLCYHLFRKGWPMPKKEGGGRWGKVESGQEWPMAEAESLNLHSLPSLHLGLFIEHKYIIESYIQCQHSMKLDPGLEVMKRQTRNHYLMWKVHSLSMSLRFFGTYAACFGIDELDELDGPP